jgi:hypothetical protein
MSRGFVFRVKTLCPVSFLLLLIESNFQLDMCHFWCRVHSPSLARKSHSNISILIVCRQLYCSLPQVGRDSDWRIPGRVVLSWGDHLAHSRYFLKESVLLNTHCLFQGHPDITHGMLFWGHLKNASCLSPVMSFLPFQPMIHLSQRLVFL